MSYRFDATTDFFDSILEIEILLRLAGGDDINRHLFLKLALVSLVTKFQVFVEGILNEFRFGLMSKPSRALPTHMLMNSLKISFSKESVLHGIDKTDDYSEERKKKVVDYLESLSYSGDGNHLIGDEFCFNTKFPLGKTGKNELIKLLKQIDGNKTPFDNFGEEKIRTLDSLLQARHLIVHQDRFSGTEHDLERYVDFAKQLVTYIDGYLRDCMIQIEKNSIIFDDPIKR